VPSEPPRVEPTEPLLETPPPPLLPLLPPESRDTAVPDDDPPPLPAWDVPVLLLPPPPPPPLLDAPPPLLLLPPDDPCDCAAAGTLSNHIGTSSAIAKPDHAGTFRFMASPTPEFHSSNRAATRRHVDRLSIGLFWAERTQNHRRVSPRQCDPRPVFLTLGVRWGSDGGQTPMLHSTTILAVRHRDKAVLAGDGQVTFGQTVVKQGARKIRRLYNDRILAGFAGSAADSFALFSRFESKLEQYRGNLERSAVELAKDWRSDRFLRRLEAMLIVLDKNAMFLLSGTGDLIEPDDGIVGIGSGGPFALAAARALAKHTELDARAIAEQAMGIAAEICIYTNANIVVEEL
jgi:ATP-dependent HslUV protease subunit HslV